MLRLMDADKWLRERGVEAVWNDVSVCGVWNDGLMGYQFKVRLNSAEGYEVSITPLPGRLTWWIHSETLEGLLNMLFEAQADVGAGRFSSWLEALKARDPIRWMDPDFKAPESEPS
jgi:hypothetical protein